jgi:predicted ArsR family transcriptional regulator
METRWDQRFFASTRGQIVVLLRRARRTVEELAAALGLTDNAVRTHLASLERDGLVRRGGARRGAGKPAYTYELTPEAERLYPKAYGAVLRRLLDVLTERLGSTEVLVLLRATGHRLFGELPTPTGDRRARAESAVALLNSWGGLAELEEHNGDLAIQGYRCPLAEAMPGHPEVCALAEQLVAEVVGTPVREVCDRGEFPRCRFAIPREVEPTSVVAGE